MAAKEGLDAHCFRTLFNQRLYEETLCRKKIIPKVGFNIREGDYPEVRKQILKRGWRRLASPRSEVAKAMIREFYANVARTEEQVAGLDQHPYTSYVRGVEIDFSLENMRRVMRFKEETPEAQHNYHHRHPTNEELNEVLRDFCEEGATWKMGKGRNPKPIQLRRPELHPLARGWQEFIINNLAPTGNKSEITVARAMLIYSIIRGDEIRAEEIIADNIILISQGLGGKGKLGYPSTIYKLCKAAKIGIQTELSNYKEVVQTLKQKQQELFANTNNMCNRILTQQEMMNKEVIDLKKWQVSETVGRDTQMKKVMEAWTEQHGYMEDMSKQMKKWTRNASARECYHIWAHQQLNPNLVEMPVTKLVKLIYENCDKKMPAFLGCLKSDHEAGSSSQAAPPATPTATPTSAATTTPAPAPQHAQDDYYPEQFFQN
ncbi:hypothetical protein PIB30_049615 [Stylosanthes scabra]|uniref:Putative plant transposon protein domain-containing protein n=1 Tax=Stylosanthes scabra TaxID=79078 RepID=A0ABU6XF48_9FABA|nr:hypothetical protein [Stylosanthes scabra]